MKSIMVVALFGSFIFAQNNDPALELANTERSFSAASEKIGIKESFLQFLSDDCVMFNPYPVNGKELYKNRSANEANLTWYPTFVEVAASGDFGISTGPWEYRAAKNDTPVAYGHYFSVWKKQNDGMWKVFLDNGISYSKEKKRYEAKHIKTLTFPDKNQSDGKSAKTELLKNENDFIQSIKKIGIDSSYSHYAAANIRLYRKGSFPSQQKKEALGLIKDRELQNDFTPVAAQVASSGDLGFTYGFSVDAKNDSSCYVRVWRKEKETEWKIAVDILEPFKK